MESVIRSICLNMQVKEEEVRKVAYDTLLEISSSLRDTSTISSDEPFQKLISMVSAMVSHLWFGKLN